MEEVPQQLILTSGYVREQSHKFVPVEIVDICFKYWQHLVEIPLECDSNRATLEDDIENGPKWLLHELDDDVFSNYHYWSPYNRFFKKDEEDWIIFRIKNENKDVVKKENAKTKSKHYWLKQVKIKNASYAKIVSGVKQMRIEISADKKEWKVCDPNPINVEKNAEFQSFDVSIKFMPNMKYFKIVFMKNHVDDGVTSFCKFVVNRLRLYGIN